MAQDKFYKCRLLSVDCWGNRRDGFEWNSWHNVEEGIWLHEDTLFSARKLLAFCRKCDWLHPESKGHLQIEDDGYNVCIQTRDGRTILAFEYGAHLDASFDDWRKEIEDYAATSFSNRNRAAAERKLERLHKELTANGCRGVELAEEIDQLQASIMMEGATE